MTRLSTLATATDKHFVHNTIPVYESLFAPIRDHVSRVLEIGINSGVSHRMWRDYFPNATVVGIDIVDLCNGMLGEDRIVAHFADAYTEEMVEKLRSTPFDVIIDDGPHSLESQCFVAQHYTGLLAPGGVLVIEDIPDISWLEALTQCISPDLRDCCYGIDRRPMAPASIFRDEILFVVDTRLR